MKVLVLGAGTIGRAIVKRLLKLGYEVIVSDVLPSDQVDIPGPCKYIRVPVGQVFDAAKGYAEVLVNAGPHSINEQAISTAVTCGMAYFDLSEDRVSLGRCRAAAAMSPTWTAVPACGLAPGFVSVLAQDMVRGADDPSSVVIHVGALPTVADNRIRHRPTWSVDGLVNEYLTPSEVLWKGKIMNKDSMRDAEEVFVCGETMEAFNTAGGIGTLHDTLKGTSVEHVEYKTLRWPGHLQQVKMLIQDLGMTREELIRVFRRIQQPVNDLVMIRVLVRQKLARKLPPPMNWLWEHAYYPLGGESAIQRLTAAGLCAMVELYASNRLGRSEGFVTQESVYLDDFMATQSGKEFGKLFV